jgi:hypothetical protein
VAERVVGVRVSIFRFVSNEPQPGIVQCELVDARGRRWTFTEKAATVSDEYLDGRFAYPRPGVIMCRVDGRQRDPSGREVAEIAIECSPDDVEVPELWTSFEVFPESLVEWEWGTKIEYS